LEAAKQTVDAVMLTQTVQPGQVQGQRQNKEGQGPGFDDLLQQKSQETAKPAEDREPKEVQKQEVQEKESPQGEAAEKPQAQEEEEVPEDAKALLAAMMLQPQAAQTEEAAAPVQEEVLVEAAAVQAPEAAQAAVQGEVPVETAPEQTAQTVRQAPEAAAQPVQTAEAATEQYVPADTPVQAAEQAAQGAQQETEAPAQAVRPEQSGETEEEEPVETPVFEPELEAVPVKVAERVLNPEKPVPLESEEAPQAMAELLTQSVEQGETISVIQLTPENLGQVTMTVTRDAEGVVHMVLEALNPKTTALLEKHTANIENIAAESLHQEVRVEIKSEQNQPFPENWQDDGKGGRQQQSQSRQKDDEEPAEDFMHRLRLGLTGSEDE